MNVISPTSLGVVLVLSLLLTQIDSAQMACSHCSTRSCVCRCLNRIASLDPTILPNFCNKRSIPEVVQSHPEQQEPTQTESSSDLSTCKKLMNLINILTRSSARESRVPITDYSENLKLTDY